MTATGRGSFIISCRQIEVDGVRLMRAQSMTVGATWRWSGTACEVEVGQDLPLVSAALGEVDVRRRAARTVRRMLAPVVDWQDELPPVPTQPLQGTDGLLTVSDGYRFFTGLLVGTVEDRGGFVVFAGRMPPQRTELRVTGVTLRHQDRRMANTERRSIPCFVGGTMIATASGPVRVEDLRPGDMIETRDGGPRPLLWKGERPVTETEVVRIQPNAFGPGLPLAPLTISPDHKILVRYPGSDPLYASRETLIAARDLTELGIARFCVAPEDARYYHLLFAEHQVIWAGGVPCESLHPADVDIGALADDQRLGLIETAPDIYANPSAYGPTARRALSGAEAALLFHKPPSGQLGS